jgi:type II secretory pathway component PulF
VTQHVLAGRDLAAFYRAFGAAWSAGLPATEALRVLAPARGGGVVGLRVKALRASLRAGETLAEGARQGPFLELERALLALGEETGRLGETVAALAAFFEADHRVALRIIRQVFPRLVTAFAGCFIVPAPLAFKVGLGAYAAASLSALGVTTFFSGALLWLLFERARSRPQYAVARLLWALALAIEAGLPLYRVVPLAAAALGPCTTARRLLAVPPGQWDGQPLSTLADACQLPRSARAMLETMERTGDTTTTLRWAARAYEEGTL